MMTNQLTIQLAINYATRLHMLQLAERLNELIRQRLQQDAGLDDYDGNHSVEHDEFAMHNPMNSRTTYVFVMIIDATCVIFKCCFVVSFLKEFLLKFMTDITVCCNML